MRALFAMSLACASIGLLAIVALSAITIVPRLEAENFRRHMILAAIAFTFAWLCLAFWLRTRSKATLPKWSRWLLPVVSIFYLLIVVAFAIG